MDKRTTIPVEHVLQMILYRDTDLLNYLRSAKLELGDEFDYAYTLQQYFQELVWWEWQPSRVNWVLRIVEGPSRLVYEDRDGYWLTVPEFVREYVEFKNEKEDI